jgi:ferrous iron transport protein A
MKSFFCTKTRSDGYDGIDFSGGICMEQSLATLRSGQRGIVTQIKITEPLRGRLYSFGLVEGTEVTVRYRSPDGGVTALVLRGTVIALRTRDIRNIRVRVF